MASPERDWSGRSPGRPGYNRLIGTLFIAGFATFAQIFDAQAVLPVIVSDTGVSPATAALTVSATTLGLALAVLPWAAIADRIGRVHAMKLGLSLSAVIALVIPLLPTVPWVIGARLVLGTALAALPAVAMAYLAEEVRRDLVPIAAAIYVAGNSLGGMTGRVLGGILGENFGWRTALFAIAVLVALAAALFARYSPPALGFAPARTSAAESAARVRSHLRNPGLVVLYLQGFCIMGAFTALYNYLGFRLLDPPFNVPPVVVSLVFLVYIVGTIASRVAAGLALRFGVRKVMLVGTLVMLSGAALTQVPLLPVVVAGLALFTVGCFSSQPLASALTGQIVAEGRAQATALYQLFWLIGTSLMGWFGGVLYGNLGWPATIVLVVSLTGVAAALAGRGVRFGLQTDPR